jgi:hypothetical protein
MFWPDHKEDVVLGTMEAGSILRAREFRLTPTDQEHHAVIFGRTGSGKSRMLQSIFVQHLNKNHGVALIEPHHDLSFDTLTYLLKHGFFEKDEAFDRLIYLDWGNGDFVPFNVLNTIWDTHTTARLAQEAMARVWPELEEAPTFQTLFLSAVSTLIANDLPLTFLYQILVDADFRKQCLTKVQDRVVIQTFEEYYDKLGRDQTQQAGSALRRAFLLTFSPVARYTLGQPDNWLNFRKIMDEGRAIIINLGNVSDHDTRKLLGALLMVQIEQAALSRTDLAPSDRTPFTLLVDEWPAFAAQERTIGTILSQTRKFNLRLWLAAQSLAQVGSARLSGALENARLSISFGLGHESASIEARHIGVADPFAIKEEPLTPTQHSQYLSVGEQYHQWTSELQNLSPRYAYVKLHDQPPVKIKTLTVPDAQPDRQELLRVLAEYRRRYQRTPADAAAAISGLQQPPRGATSSGTTGAAYTRMFGGKKGP